MTYISDELGPRLSKLWSWLETWMDEDGGVHGYIIYHHRDNLKILSPDTWTQSTCILGLLELYRATKEEKWLRLAERLSHYLVNAYIPKLHIFRNSNFDRKPLGQPALEGNALASYALLETAKRLRGPKENEVFIETAKDNIVNSLLRNWDQSVGAFTSIYHGAPAHIHNKNSLTLLALISLSELEGSNESLSHYSERTGKFIIDHQVKKGAFAGAYPYADDDKNYRTIYTLITCLGLLELYKKNKDTTLLESVVRAVQHLLGFLDLQTGLICHIHRVGYPQWVTDTSLLLMVANKLSKLDRGILKNDEEILDKLLNRQYKNGAFPLSIGFEDLWYKKRLPSRPEIKRWRDVLPIPGLNSWVFWALSSLLPSVISIPFIELSFPLILTTDPEEREGPYRIIESEEKVIFEKIESDHVLGIFEKKADIAYLCQIKERLDYWKTIDSIMSYPEPLRRLILGIPNKLFG